MRDKRSEINSRSFRAGSQLFSSALLCLWLYILSPAPSVCFAADAGAPTIKILHVFVQADINQVSFENIWVFQRQQAQTPWQVSAALPAAAANVRSDEPNDPNVSVDSGRVRKKMVSDSLIDSLGFSFLLPNEGGVCRTELTAGYPVELMVVSVSGPATKLVSDILKVDSNRQAHSKFSGVYTARNLPAGAKIEISLTSLPQKESGLIQIISAAGLGLIILLALVTMYRNRRKPND